MAGRRLLDAAVLGNVARTVAKQHLKIRSAQLDRWNKTSSVAKAVKNQTDRVTLTVQAASALVQRFNEPDQARYYAESQDDSVPRHETVVKRAGDTSVPKGLNQDHHYEPSEQNAASDPPTYGDLEVEQEKANRYPTQDGTIPPKDAPVETGSPATIDADVKPTRPETAPPKNPVVHEEESRNEGLDPKQAIPDQTRAPDGVNTDVFHSPRVSEMLRGNSKSNRSRKDGPGVQSSQSDTRDKSEATYQEMFTVRNSDFSQPPEASNSQQNNNQFTQSQYDDVHTLAAEIAKDVDQSVSEEVTDRQERASTQPDDTPPRMRESRVPSSRFGRIAEYGSLATSMAFGAVGETFRRVTGQGSGGSLMLSAGNMERLVAKLSRMRGAALKLGQMMSFQDSKMLPEPINDVLQRVQDNADYMPISQRDRVLASNLGDNWRSLFSTFDDVPMAAASIGQVHRATLASSNTTVAVKIQYPGVATSISSDLSNLSLLLTASRLLPKGLYLDKTIANAREELAWECDYEREARCQERFRDLLADEADIFTVPAVFREASGPQVLTAEMMPGTAVTKQSLHLTQAERDWIGTHILRLCLRELTEFRFMQTDPNWTNFLFNRETRRLELLDFGAAREFPDTFVDPYVRVLAAAAKEDRSTVRDLSVQLGYLTGNESQRMVDAHVASVLTLAEPFRKGTSDGVYDFRDQTITDRVRAQIPIMLRERLAPPPEETYSLHRRLSGSFLLLARLGSRVRCRDMFVNAINVWEAQQASRSDRGSSDSD